MELSQKIKTALGETRILILGGQILFGFALRGVFADAFDRLPGHAKFLDAVGLGLMVIVVALLIVPEPYHRMVERGSDSGELHDLVTDIADMALLPFALALGVEVFVAVERIFDAAVAAGGGAVTAIVALALWYGLPRARRRSAGKSEWAMTERQRKERPETPLHVKIDQLLTEARVILPGAQALFGFQLSIVLTQGFERLPLLSRFVHAASLGLVALSVVLLMAPAAYHRIVFAGEDSAEMYRAGSYLITLALLPLALGLAGDLYVVIAKIGGETAGVASGVCGLILLLGLWYAYPLVAMASGEGAPAKSQRQSG